MHKHKDFLKLFSLNVVAAYAPYVIVLPFYAGLPQQDIVTFSGFPVWTILLTIGLLFQGKEIFCWIILPLYLVTLMVLSAISCRKQWMFMIVPITIFCISLLQGIFAACLCEYFNAL